MKDEDKDDDNDNDDDKHPDNENDDQQAKHGSNSNDTDFGEIEDYLRKSDELNDLFQSETWHNFTLLSQIATGGMGSVWLVKNELGLKVALKRIRYEQANDVLIQMFKHEIEVLHKLNHASIVQIRGSGVYEKTLYYTMQYIEGEALDERYLEKDDPPDSHGKSTARDRARDLIAYGIQTARALAYAHLKDIWHRDIKPNNLMLAEGHLYVIDFGLAVHKELQNHGRVGTPNFMSPEQIAEDAIDGRTDVFSLGVTLCHLLTKKFPYKTILSSDTTEFDSRLREIERNSPKIDLSETKLDEMQARHLKIVLETALRYDKKQRYTASEFADDLENVLEGRAITAKEATSWDRWTWWYETQGKKVAIWVIAGLCLILAVAGIWFWTYTIEKDKRLQAETNRADAESKKAIAEAKSATAESLKAVAEKKRADAEEKAKQQAEARELEAKTSFLERLVRSSIQYSDAVDYHAGLMELAKALEVDLPKYRPEIVAQINATLSHASILRTFMDTSAIPEKSLAGGPLFEQDGTSFLVWYKDNTVARFDADSGKLLQRLSTKVPLGRVFVGSQGQIAATGLDLSSSRDRQDNWIQLWDRQTKKWIEPAVITRGIGEPVQLTGPVSASLPSPDSGAILSVSFDNTSRLVGIGSKNNTGLLWSKDDGILLKVEHQDDVVANVFSFDGRAFVTASSDGSVFVYDLPSKKRVHEIDHQGRLTKIRISPVGFIATAGEDVKLWQLETGKRFGNPISHPTSISTVEFSPDGKWMLVAGGNTLQTWNTQSLRQGPLHIQVESSFEDVKFSPNGNRLAVSTGDRIARVWDVETGKPITSPFRQGGYIEAVAFTNGGSTLRVASRQEKLAVVRTYDLPIRRLEFTAHEKKVLGGLTKDDRFYSYSESNIAGWQVPKNNSPDLSVGQLTRYAPRVKRISTASFSRDRKILYFAGTLETVVRSTSRLGIPVQIIRRNNSVYAVNQGGRSAAVPWNHGTEEITNILERDNGELITTTQEGNVYQLLDDGKKKAIYKFEVPKAGSPDKNDLHPVSVVPNVKFSLSKSAPCFASAYLNELTLHRISNGKVISQETVPAESRFRAIALTKDAKWMVSARMQNDVTVMGKYSLSKSKAESRFIREESVFWTIAEHIEQIECSDHVVATLGDSGTIRFFSLKSNLQVGPSQKIDDAVCLFFSADAQWVFVGSSKGKVSVLPVPSTATFPSVKSIQQSVYAATGLKPSLSVPSALSREEWREIPKNESRLPQLERQRTEKLLWQSRELFHFENQLSAFASRVHLQAIASIHQEDPNLLNTIVGAGSAKETNRLVRARAFMAAANYSAAIEDFEPLYAENRNSAAFWLRSTVVANIEESKTDEDLFVDIIKPLEHDAFLKTIRGIEIQPNVNLDWQRLDTELSLALEIDKQNSRLWRNKGVASLMLREFRAATTEFNQARTLHQNSKSITRLYLWALAFNQDWKNLRAELDSQDSDHWAIALLVAVERAQANEWDSAIQKIREALNFSGVPKLVNLILIDYLIHAEKWSEAADALKTEIARQDDETLWTQLATTYLLADRLDEYRQFCKSLSLRLSSLKDLSKMTAICNICMFHPDSGISPAQIEPALKYLGTSSRQLPFNAKMAIESASTLAYLRAGKTEPAIASFQRLSRHKDARPLINLWHALSYAKAGKETEAKIQLDRVPLITEFESWRDVWLRAQQKLFLQETCRLLDSISPAD